MADIPWTMTRQTYEEYGEIFGEIYRAAKNEDAIAYECALDRLKSLPGFPRNIHPDLDLVVPVDLNGIPYRMPTNRSVN